MSALLVVFAMSVQAVAAGDGVGTSALASAGATAAASPGNVPGEVPLKALVSGELRDVIQAGLRRWARPAPKDVPQAARELLALYRQVLGDKSLSSTERETLRQRLRTRLIALGDQINAKAAHEARLAANAPGGHAVADPASVRLPDDRGANLAQMGVALPAGGAGIGVGGAAADAAAADNGQQLVDLIQQTIAPHTWDVNGGPGVIYYWQPGKAIAVRQTSDVHEQLGGLANQLRQAGN